MGTGVLQELDGSPCLSEASAPGVTSVFQEPTDSTEHKPQRELSYLLASG